MVEKTKIDRHKNLKKNLKRILILLVHKFRIQNYKTD